MDGYYGRRADVASRVVDGEAVLVKVPQSVLFVLNPSASRIWLMADGVRSGAELAEDSDSAAVASFLKQMVEFDLVERTSAPQSKAEAFPQEAEISSSTEPPAIRISEPLETLAGPSVCNQIDEVCGTIM